MNSREAEKHELERAVELMGRGTRPGRLLEYLGAKYFQEHAEQLTEFTIATEVFGRSIKNFDPTADAVVRVEAHRLRKKLRDIYEKDDRREGMQISLPAGTYVPRFTLISASDQAVARQPAGLRRVPVWGWSLGVVAAIVVGIVVANMSGRSRQARPEGAAAQAAKSSPPSAAPGGAVTEVHFLAGYTGSEVIDNSGVRWTPDRYAAGGGHWSRYSGFVRGTSRPFLFANWRTGEFGYDIPLVPGNYELRLFFVSPFRPGDEKISSFNVALNGRPLLEAYDPNISANGADVADEQVFRDIRPGEDGFLRLWFTNHAGSPMLNGLELTPGTPGKLNPIRIITQPTSFVDHQGQRWRADDYYQNGFQSTERRTVSGTDDPELFGAERYGHFSYAIPVDRRGRYTVVLHFAEFYHGPQLPGGGGVGSRRFNVFCNGQTLLRDFDVFKEAGSLRVVTKRFEHIEPSGQGKVNLMFEPVVNNATVSGIEILDETK